MREKLEAIGQIFTYVESSMLEPNESTVLLREIASLFDMHRLQSYNKVIRYMAALEFLPSKSEEVEAKAERLITELPALLPCLSSLVHVFCIAAKKIDWIQSQPDQRDMVVTRLASLQELISKIPPPFDSRVTVAELQSTVKSLSHISADG